MFNVKTKSGYSLVEMLIYVAILTIVSILVVNTILSFTRSYRDLEALRVVEHSGIDSMERMTRDIRAATGVDIGNSVFNTSPGVLTIVTTANSVSTTTKFYLDNGVLKVDINGTLSGPLTLTSASITNLTFRRLVSGISEAVKIDMTIQATVGNTTKVRTYHSTIMLTGL